MKSYFIRFTVLATLFVETSACVWAQVADISLPKQRDKVIETASGVLAARSVPVSLPDSVSNPFDWPADPVSIENAAIATPSAAPAMGKELLARLAAQIPVTGTVYLGGEPILLLGQKRLKVGDKITISFEGQDYDLSIAAIASTSFTIKRGELIHTRPTHISTSSRP